MGMLEGGLRVVCQHQILTSIGEVLLNYHQNTTKSSPNHHRIIIESSSEHH
jgi:hypothetical protein